MSQPLKFVVILLLLAFPLVEIGILIRVGQALGFWRLALIVLGTALIGTAVIRRIGISVLQKTMSRIESGRGGLEPMFEGLLLALAGVLLILPGLISDALGLLLLIPPVRHFIMRSGLPKLFTTSIFRTEVFEGRFEARRRPPDPAPREEPGVVIEGEYERLAEEPIDPPRHPAPRKSRS
jgi:UPF0716 protein FxsA